MKAEPILRSRKLQLSGSREAKRRSHPLEHIPTPRKQRGPKLCTSQSRMTLGICRFETSEKMGWEKKSFVSGSVPISFSRDAGLRAKSPTQAGRRPEGQKPNT